MAKKSRQSNPLASLVEQFAASLDDLLERTSMERARLAVLSAFGGNSAGAPARRGRPPATVSPIGAARKRRKKAPIQLCPVPGCKNRAAPVFGMVCSKHKDLPKAKIRQYREARRVQKAKTKAKAA
jgi:hypothetical protein